MLLIDQHGGQRDDARAAARRKRAAQDAGSRARDDRPQ